MPISTYFAHSGISCRFAVSFPLRDFGAEVLFLREAARADSEEPATFLLRGEAGLRVRGFPDGDVACTMLVGVRGMYEGCVNAKAACHFTCHSERSEESVKRQ